VSLVKSLSIAADLLLVVASRFFETLGFEGEYAKTL